MTQICAIQMPYAKSYQAPTNSHVFAGLDLLEMALYAEVSTYRIMQVQV